MTPAEALVVLMFRWVPCDVASCEARYAAIANDAIEVGAVDPLPFAREPSQTAVWLLATASLESRFDDAAVSRTGDRCIMQVHPIGSEDVSTRVKCMQTALGRLHWSYDVCHRGEWLSPYKTGKCYAAQRDARVNRVRALEGVRVLYKLTH